jgi:tRNA (Thr-GGU) A37 N-methylase
VSYIIRPIGWVESPLTDRDVAPKQGDEVRNLEALDGTPVVDIKPVLAPVGER